MASKDNDLIENIFDVVASEYGKQGCGYFNYFGKVLVRHTCVLPGSSVLDIATGKGAVLEPLAHVVGSQGQVMGIDLSSNMLQELSKSSVVKENNWINLLKMDAENLNFPDQSFDYVLCGLALFFFSNLQEALSEIKRVLKPKGTFASSIGGKSSLLTSWIVGQFKEMGIETPLPSSFLKDESALLKALNDAGFIETKIYKEQKTFWHDTPEAWYASLQTHGIRLLFEQASQNQKDQLIERALEKAHSLQEEKGVPETFEVICAVSQKGRDDL